MAIEKIRFVQIQFLVECFIIKYIKQNNEIKRNILIYRFIGASFLFFFFNYQLVMFD